MAVAGFALLLAGCEDKAADELPIEAEFERHWPGHVAANDEYRIQAMFPEDQPVCVSDPGTHSHGFHQWRDGDCADASQLNGRFLSVYADHNAMEYSWTEAAEQICGPETEPFEIGVEATGEGRLFGCIPKLCGEQYVITALYLVDSPMNDLGDYVADPEGGPDFLYYIALGTTSETQEADLAEFRTFLSNLRLDGDGFRPTES